MKELSIFVDESGDFGEYDYRAPFYIISMVLYDQSRNIAKDVMCIDAELKNIGWTDHCVHAGPVIRAEKEYRGYDVRDRQKILMRMMSFIRHVDIFFIVHFGGGSVLGGDKEVAVAECDCACYDAADGDQPELVDQYAKYFF